MAASKEKYMNSSLKSLGASPRYSLKTWGACVTRSLKMFQRTKVGRSRLCSCACTMTTGDPNARYLAQRINTQQDFWSDLHILIHNWASSLIRRLMSLTQHSALTSKHCWPKLEAQLAWEGLFFGFFSPFFLEQLRSNLLIFKNFQVMCKLKGICYWSIFDTNKMNNKDWNLCQPLPIYNQDSSVSVKFSHRKPTNSQK